MGRSIPFLVAFAWLGACSGEAPPEEVPQGPSRADSVELAQKTFDAAVFDTIVWESDQAAIDRGGLVYRISCSKCHGDGGRGNGNFVARGDTLRPPSFLTTDWRFADDDMGLRQAIFSGNVEGMPYWGLVGLGYRDVDSVSRYISGYLRPTYGGGN
jgi:mono/diheme cytochrome c family protein